MIKRVITIVLDGFGIGELPDAKNYKDEGSNTLAGIYHNTNLYLPNLKKMGLYNIDGISLEEKQKKVIGSYRKGSRAICWKKQSCRTLGNKWFYYHSWIYNIS